MDPMTIAALIQAGIGLAGGIQKGVASVKQKKMANEYGKTKRPDYQIPPSLQKATDMARANLNPEINKQLLQEIAANSATAINRAGKVGTSTADMLAAIGGINANENAAKRQFFGDNQQRKDLMLGQYMNQLGAMAGQENKAWEWNKAQPYLNAQDAAQALNQSSAQNAAGALGDLAAGLGGSAKSLMMGKQMDIQSDQMKQMMELLGYGGETTKAGLGGSGIESLGQKGLPVLSEIAKPDTDPNAPYKPNAADLLGFSKNLPLPKNTDANISPAAQIAATPQSQIESLLSNKIQPIDATKQPIPKLNADLVIGGDADNRTPLQKQRTANFLNKEKVLKNMPQVGRDMINTLVNTPNLLKNMEGVFSDRKIMGGVKPIFKNTNANTPAAVQIAENPVTPTIFTTTTGKIIENGKPMTPKYENNNGVVTKDGEVINPPGEYNLNEMISSIGAEGVDYAIDNALKAKGYTKEDIAMIRSIGKDAIDYAMKEKTKQPITRSGVFGQPRPKVGESLSRQISPALDMILKLMNK